MYRYLHFLLNDFSIASSKLQTFRDDFISDEGSADYLINLILETELKVYVTGLIDYPLSPKYDIVTDSNVVELDKNIQRYRSFFESQELRQFAFSSFNPIWRVAAITCEFLIQADKEYKK